MDRALSNTVVGAMLFGGTLGPALAASAGVVVGSLDVTAAYVSLDAMGQGFQPTTLSGALAGGIAYDSATGSYLRLSAFTDSGFSLNAVSDGGGIWSVFGCSFTFTALQDVTGSLSGAVGADAAYIWLYDVTASTTVFQRFSGGAEAWGSGSLNLLAGHEYTLAVNPSFANGGTDSGMVLNFSVPAPGALALLGVAGIVGSRRRR
jgi:hypothetical protein